MTEQQALSRYATHTDAEAFAELVQMHQQMVYASALRRLGNAEDAADATQQAFIRLAKHAGSIRGAVGPWLHRTVVNAATDLMRGAASRRQRESEYASLRPGESWPDDVPWEPISQMIDDAIAELAQSDRQLIVQHYLLDRPQTQLATDLGVSQATVSRRLAAAVDALREKLLERGVTAPAAGALATGLAVSTATAAVPDSVTAELTKVGLLGASTGLATAGAVKLTVALLAVVGMIAGGLAIAWSAAAPPTPPRPVPAMAAAPPAHQTVPLTDALRNRLGPAAPYVDENTLVVGSVNLSAIDANPTLDWLAAQLDALGPQAQPMATQLAATRPMLLTWRQRFLDAGGSQIFILSGGRDDVDDRPGWQWVAYFIPLDPEDDADAVANLFPAQGNGPRDPHLVRTPDGLFFGMPPDEMADSADRPGGPIPVSLAEALHEAPIGPLWITFAPTPRWQQMMFGREHEFDEIQRQLATMQWIYLTLTSLPLLQGQAVLEMGEPDRARALVDALRTPEDGQALTALFQMALDRTKLAGTTLRLDIGDDLFRSIVDFVVGSRHLAMLTANMRAAASAARSHRLAHGVWPESLAALDLPSQLDRSSFVFRRPTIAPDDPAAEQTVLLYPRFDDWPKIGLAVIYVDGHLELVHDRERFDRLTH